MRRTHWRSSELRLSMAPRLIAALPDGRTLSVGVTPRDHESLSGRTLPQELKVILTGLCASLLNPAQKLPRRAVARPVS